MLCGLRDLPDPVIGASPGRCFGWKDLTVTAITREGSIRRICGAARPHMVRLSKERASSSPMAFSIQIRLSSQLGVAVVLKELMALDPSISFDDAPSSPGGAPEPDVALAEDVAFVQQSLNKLGIDPQLVEDGILGPRTKAAVSLFQRQNALKDTGLPDAVTIAEIAKRSAQPAPVEPTVTMPTSVQPTLTMPTVRPTHGDNAGRGCIGSDRAADARARADDPLLEQWQRVPDGKRGRRVPNGKRRRRIRRRQPIQTIPSTLSREFLASRRN